MQLRAFLKTIGKSAFFANNSKKDYFLILIAAFTLTIISIDIQSELARDKREIESMIVLLEKTFRESTFLESSFFIFILSFLGVLFTDNTRVSNNIVLNFPRDRSPPQ